MTFDSPSVAAARILSAPRPVLIALDVDGVLAPIVDHASDAALLAGVGPILVELTAMTPVAIVSGRSMHDLTELFDFPVAALVYGSHGLERRGVAMPPLDSSESARLEQLVTLAQRAADEAGAGAWVERKLGSVVLHVRQASATAGHDAVAALRSAASLVTGAKVIGGRLVVELFARPASKATALADARARTLVDSVVFVGDDDTDEEAMRTLDGGDVGIRVGDGETVAPLRIRDPGDVADMLGRVAAGLAGR